MTELTAKEAALLEGLAPMPEDLIPLRDEKMLLDEEIKRLEARKADIRDVFDERLKDAGLKAYMIGDEVRARRSEGQTTTLDSKLLKKEMPHVFTKYARTKPNVRVTIS